MVTKEFTHHKNIRKHKNAFHQETQVYPELPRRISSHWFHFIAYSYDMRQHKQYHSAEYD